MSHIKQIGVGYPKIIRVTTEFSILLNIPDLKTMVKLMLLA